MQTQKPAASPPPPPPLAGATPPAPSQGEAGEQQRPVTMPTVLLLSAAAVTEPVTLRVKTMIGGGSADPEPSPSRELDDSGDDDFSQTSSGDDDDEEATEESEEDLSNFLFDTDLNAQVTEIIQWDPCENRCVHGRAKELESLLCSLPQMSKPEKNTSLYTLLAVLMQVPVDRKRGSGNRERFNYYLPFVGQVCRPIFARCYGVVLMTLQRYKRRIRDGNMAMKDHGNKFNKNASQVDVVWLVKWFTSFAEEVGEVVPVCVRMQKKIDGSVQKYYSSDKYTLLLAHFTWEAIWDEMHKFVESELRVCDVCAIYHGMRGGVTADKTEALSRHTESARLMRLEYKCDKTFCSSGHAVIGMDYSQNLTIPTNDGVQTNYIYDESTSSKGSDQLNSMLAHFIETKLVPSGKTKLTEYSDNCSGQNKNNYVIKLLLTLVDMGIFEHVDFKFFHVIDAVNAAAANSVTVHVPWGSKLFKSCKPVLTELYKWLHRMQQYQIFSIDGSKPGVVACKKGPNSDAEEQDLRRNIDGILTAKEKVARIMTYHIEILPPHLSMPRKKKQMYKSIRPYVPDEFQNDPLYAKPSEDEGAAAKTKKQARLTHRAAMAAAAKKNQEGRGMAAQKKRAAPSKKAFANSKKRKSSATPEADDE
ncbi:hypothetical protein PHYSODRAFT_327292 [Phytophthora sojae]|uniref:DUF7869 domain-containing protein n=1 Tax=Phytophthora sojae (strain P6497) TaxID=1094619 RepID=G4Z0S5_PHYSP|nr:hypothetical protein PHYSODRAFT_327292 [Phytophthora sojae]EGZ26381.1 hypothetical protein PHYSODRAFT_327292 [Phytophthora sojae]|eukprot:XP_009521669.1 hypothetical protein PHYSODRAFT_327292 [Phytophthora sojae]